VKTQNAKEEAESRPDPNEMGAMVEEIDEEDESGRLRAIV